MATLDEKYGMILAAVLDAAKENAEQMKDSQDILQQGEVLAYEHVLEIALEHAEVVGVDPADLGMDPTSLLKTG